MSDEALDVTIVDDDPAVRDSLGTIFEIEGFRVRTYADGDLFLADVKQIRTDCVGSRASAVALSLVPSESSARTTR